MGTRYLGEGLRRARGKILTAIETGKRLSGRLLDKIVDVGDFIMYPTDILRIQESIACGIASVMRRGGFSMMPGGDQ